MALFARAQPVLDPWLEGILVDFIAQFLWEFEWTGAMYLLSWHLLRSAFTFTIRLCRHPFC